MNKLSFHWTPLAVLLTSLSSPLLANDAPIIANHNLNNTNTDDSQIDANFVITASRVASLKETVGSSISILDSTYLEQNKITTLSDVLRDIPGLAVSRSGSYGGKTQIRIRGAEANQTLVLIDGIEVNDVVSTSEFDFGGLMATDIERIEILRGAQSALWGSDAMGGVINIITKKGRGPLNYNARVEINSQNSLLQSTRISGGNDQGDFAVSISQFDTDGISSANQVDGNSEKDGYNNQNFQLQSGLNINTNTRLDLIVSDKRSYSEYDGYPAPSYTFADTNEHSEGQQTAAKVALDWLSDDATWNHQLSAEYGEQGYKIFKDASQTGTRKGSKSKAGYQGSYYFDTRNTSQRLTMVLETERDRYHNNAAISGEQVIDTNSAVIEYGLDLNDRIFTTFALRQDDSSKYKTANTYHVGIAAWATENTRIHASQGTGVKNPTFTELYGYGTSTIGNLALEQEQNLTTDLGIEYHFGQQQGTLDFTLFHSDIDNLITYVYNSTTFKGQNFNTAKADVRGAEITLALTPNDQVRLDASYTYTDSDDGTGKSLARRAKSIASLNSSYLLANRKTRITTGVQYNGSQYDSSTLLDAYTLVNTSINHAINDQVTLYTKVDNVFDANYEEIKGYGTLGRTVTLGVNIQGIL